MAGHLLFNSGSNESSLAPQFKWLDNTFKGTGSPDGLRYFLYVQRDEGINKCRGWFLNF
jgi:hypothetical protein